MAAVKNLDVFHFPMRALQCFCWGVGYGLLPPALCPEVSFSQLLLQVSDGFVPIPPSLGSPAITNDTYWCLNPSKKKPVRQGGRGACASCQRLNETGSGDVGV